MEGKILEAIYHVKSISKKKPSYKNVLSYIQKSTASNIDLEVIEETVLDMVTKNIIDKDFRILNESCNSYTLPQFSDDVIETLYLEKGSKILQKSVHGSIDNLETTPLASLQDTPNLPNSIAKFNAIEANLMGIKSYFKEEVYDLRNEISSLKSMLNKLISNRTETDNQITTDTLNNNILETKIVFLEKENSLLRSEIKNKQDTIQNLLKNNTTLVESINTSLILPTHNKSDPIKSVHHGKGKNDLNSSKKTETSETIASSNAKMRDPQEKENRTKKSGRHVCIIGDSMVKHITGPGISKNDQVQVKAHPGATAEDIIDYIKPTIRQKPDIIIIHSGTNNLTKDVNTMSRVRKVVAAVKEIDTEGNIKLGFYGIVARVDINKEEDIVITNDRLEKYCKGNEFFFIKNSNIDVSCLNKSKLHLNRKGAHYLANNFRKHIFDIE